MYGATMDRRQKKTREAIFTAFTNLLSQKHYNQITVGEIISHADIGRATFYAHFETKDSLLKELCNELFCHIFDAAENSNDQHRHIFACDAPDSAFLHLIQHMLKNDNGILELLACESNALFLSYFKENLQKLISQQLHLFDSKKSKNLPTNFWVHHIAVTFVETIRWWIENGMQESPETLTEYFNLAI